MTYDETHGQIAYEAWGEAELKRLGAAYEAHRVPPFWEALPADERASWEAAGAAVRQAVNADRDPRSRP